jgi:hypothetical protein
MNQAIAMHTANVSCTEEEIEELDENVAIREEYR